MHLKSSIMYKILTLLFITLFIQLTAQQTITGIVIDETNKPVDFATIALKSAKDSSLVKVETTDLNGAFKLIGIAPGSYFITSTFLGFTDSNSEVFKVDNQLISLPKIIMAASSQKLDEVLVTAQRAMVEIKPDRTIFNVQGTINSIGDNLINLLRKAPGVLVDNNDNITVLSRSGVLVYVDGRRLPLSGQDLTSYLQNISSDQVDRIDIITNPSSKYEAQGNAGIIDIRLKKDKNLGSNGSVSSSFSQGRYHQANLNGSANYRNKKMNVFSRAGVSDNESWNELIFDNYQNNLVIRDNNQSYGGSNSLNFSLGSDFFITNNTTIGALYSTVLSQSSSDSDNRSTLSNAKTPTVIDSVLIANNSGDADRNQQSFNINLASRLGKNNLNIDLDYARFRNDAFTNQPNEYFDPNGILLTRRNVEYNTPRNIDISSVKIDYEQPTNFASLSYGAKFTKVVTDNTFLFYNNNSGTPIRNDSRSNQFNYDENVFAGYGNMSKALSQKVNLSGGLRVEHTIASGILKRYPLSQEEDAVDFNYTSFFPSAGITYQSNPKHGYSLNYGRRINRPDYNVLNPFREQLSELSYSRGNERLKPEIVNNIEFGYTLNYLYNFKVAYSLTSDQITRLIGPDDVDPRAGFISYDNLATQKIYSFNFSAPVSITTWWNSYFNVSATYTDNQAVYPNGAVVDVQAGSYSLYQQQTFSLPNKYKFEISGYYAGPGVWGGVFLYNPTYSLNFGIQRKFLNDALNIRLSASDVTFRSGWNGESNFNGLRGVGRGNYDSRRGAISVSYDFGNNNVKSRRRSTGIESEKDRVGG